MITPLRRHRTMPLKTITRQQLQQGGVSAYQARRITDQLVPIAVEGRTKVYALQDVIAAMRSQLAEPHYQPQTRKALKALLNDLLKRLDNVVEAPFGKSPEEKMSFYVYRILEQSKPDKSRPSAE
ncbi:hypothetical protein GS597_07885 [Synechococcales cyanobacterium C]|uniref:Uncharacterized protein n=1 Tax=Petrachloros mirabilis ULC683 TaxID=2781853 RepID=A0A8K1ZYQ0_9CYAN|nr:hypothetical protein [Petrachloros mirabilis]NCJ06431.1 hypothetical protein [Petrachloros mirabilis ULC683]